MAFDDFLNTLPSIPGRPMLAGRVEEKDFSLLRFPLLGSMKIDGYRGIYSDGVFFTRVGKRHPAPAVQALAAELKKRGLPNGLEGELTIKGKPFSEAGGLLRRLDYSGPVFFHIFDWMNEELNAQERYQVLTALSGKLPFSCAVLKQTWLTSLEEFMAFEEDCIMAGGEGICLKTPLAKYKHNRGTMKDQTLLKIKRFRTAEAKILSVSPRLFNGNEKEENPLGYAERSTAKENLIPTDVLGTMEVVGLNGDFKDTHFSIGNFNGLSDPEKKYYLKNPPLNKVVTYKYFPEGSEERPRHPVFLYFRPDWDLEKEGENENDIER